MEINNFISTVLDELQDLKSKKEKKRYVVQELEFELGVVINNQGNGNIKFDLFNVSAGLGADISKENIQKVKIKLKPKPDVETITHRITQRND